MLNVLTQPEDSELKRFWDLETLGIEACDHIKDKNDFTEQYCKNNIKMVNGRYEAKLPWLNDHGELPSNLEIANYRTRSMVRRLAKTPELFKTYDNIIQDQLNQGFIELVPQSEMVTSNKVHYLPHHPVLKDSTTTPIRIVFDCSCAQGDLPSLNDCLECGPPLINDLASLLLRFRVGKYAVTADIEKAFLNVGLDSSDRDITRFFWPVDPSNPESDFNVFRFKGVLFGAKCSPFILNSTIIHHLSEVRDTHEVAEIMQQNIYVDNILTSFQQATDVVHFYKESCSIMSNANFNLRSWATNCPDLELPEPNQCSFIKVLGLSWNVEKDILMLKTFNDSYMSNESPITKRSILQHIAKIFDPIGVLTPVTIRARILLQNLWKESFDWDTHLPEPFSCQWKEVVSDLKDILQLEIPRQYSCLLDFAPQNSDCTILHVFADASSSAYGTVCYLQTPRNISFVIAKSRVAPVKSLTIPQLELMAATLAARLGSRAFDALKTVIPTLQIQFWSDSTITLGWISSNKTLPPFVSNRVNEIHKLSKDSTWMYCPSELNPADILTRGTTAQQLQNNQMWLYGPEWLKDSKRPFKVCMSLPVNTLDNSNPPIINDLEFGIHNVIDFDRYSDLTKLLRVTAWVLRFINNTQKTNNSVTGPLQVSDLETAKRVLIQNTQNKAYSDVIRSLRNTNSTHRHSIIDQLQLFMDSKDIIRCRGRLHNTPLEDNAKYPILLPKKHAFSRLIVLDVHKKVLHSGVNSTLTSLRSAFWIPQARQLVRSLLKHCVVCRRLTCKPYRAPNPPPLPHSRVSEVPPFYYTGVDFCGPLLVRAAKIKKKCYICLFTCAVTRAVHLELTHDLTTDSFISALRRFASRRSLPRKIFSDNASTFIGANTSLRDLFLSNELHEKLCLRGVQWEFITKRAPWQGGFYERLIGITKLTLKKVLYRALVDFEELRTIITEIEACINNRPLVYVSEDIADGEALTPSHFLTGQVTTLPHPPVFDDELDDPQYDIHSDDLEKRARHRAVLFQKFKNRWAHEYLTSLREFHKFPGVNQETVKIGSVVLIKEDNIKRLNWKYGMITAIHRGSDGHIRTVSVKTQNGNTNRPISKLYPLEVHNNFTEPVSSDTTSQTQSCPNQDNLNLHHTDSRPRRSAAIRAQKRIQSWLSSD